MAQIGELRASAKALGIPASDIRGASSEELQSLILDRVNGGSTKPARKTVTRAANASTARKTA